VAVLGAGRQWLDTPVKYPQLIRGKPIFIGAGTKDPNFPHARKAAEVYKSLGGKVTFEEFKGLGHEMDTNSKLLREWLAATSRPKAVEANPAAREADRECKAWLALADNYLTAGNTDKAREYLQKILDQHGETRWAAEAQQRLEKLEKAGK
jgi:acetyl esterase/lipase